MSKKNLEVPFLSVNHHEDDNLTAVSSLLDGVSRNTLDYSPWAEYPYKPEVEFAIAYTDSSILLKYYVTEEFLRAYHNRINEPVYKDSCVEFFVAIGEESSYYNFEFNCAGNCLASFGPDRNQRKRLEPSFLEKIQSQTLLKPMKSNESAAVNWELTVVIPFQTFAFHSITSLAGTSCSANFYKCGDDLPKPHFLAWNNIISDTPDFHLFPYFGKLKF